MDKMDHNAHSVYLMYYHLIMVVKYRRKVIDDPISERAKEIWERIAPDYGITLEEWNHDVDHVHVMFRAQPKSELSKFINAYKSASSRLLKKEYPQIRERLWKEAFWSQSFCLLTAGGAPIDVIRNYIETQGEKKKMNIAYHFRIYPNREQEVLLAKTFGCCRFLYNQMLNDKIREYEATKKMLRNTPAMYKKAYPFLKEVDSLALANVQMHLEKAYKNFFRDPKIGFPKFKSKHRSRKSYTTNVVNGNIQVEDHQIKLSKLKWIRMKKHRDIPEKYCLKSVTISMEPSGKYYASLLYEKNDCENQAEELDYEDAKILGIDYAMHGMAVFSEDIQKENEGYFRKSEERLAREQRKLSHCVKGSNNYYRQKKRVALCHEKIRNQRKDFLHKLSHEMAETYDVVAVEDIDMKAMSQCMHLGKSVMDNGYGKFRELLEYKLTWRGKKLVRVDRFFPSSKKCCKCGSVKKELNLSDRVYFCTCGNRIDRDLNAAINIREEARRMLLAG